MAKVDGLQIELFDAVDGRRALPCRRGLSIGSRRPSTAAVLAQLRNLLHHELGNVSLSLRRIERAARMQLEFHEVTNDALERVLARLVRLERAVGVVEDPVSRRRPLGEL